MSVLRGKEQEWGAHRTTTSPGSVTSRWSAPSSKNTLAGRTPRAFGLPVSGESQEELDKIADEARILARQGLVQLMKEDGEIYYLRIDELTHQNRPDRIRAEHAQVGWLKKCLERDRGFRVISYPAVSEQLTSAEKVHRALLPRSV